MDNLLKIRVVIVISMCLLIVLSALSVFFSFKKSYEYSISEIAWDIELTFEQRSWIRNEYPGLEPNSKGERKIWTENPDATWSFLGGASGVKKSGNTKWIVSHNINYARGLVLGVSTMIVGILLLYVLAAIEKSRRNTIIHTSVQS